MRKILESLSKKKLIILILAIVERMKREKDFMAFANALGKAESNNNYYAKNSLGYLGYYQFGKARLCDLGYTERIKQGFTNNCFDWKDGMTDEGFLNNPCLQDKVFKEHVENLLNYIDKHCSFYFDKMVAGARVTRSGCVAFAHLAGLGGLKKFLMTGFDPKDVVSGVPATTYMKKFSGYDLKVVT